MPSLYFAEWHYGASRTLATPFCLSYDQVILGKSTILVTPRGGESNSFCWVVAHGRGVIGITIFILELAVSTIFGRAKGSGDMNRTI